MSSRVSSQVTRTSHRRSIAIVPNREKIRAYHELPRLRQWLKKRGIAVLPLEQLEKAEMVLTLGGDGTILSIASRAARAGVPVLGVNIGRLGFMTAAELRHLYRVLDLWLHHRLVTSPRLMLEVTAPRIQISLLALNDVVVRIASTPRVTNVVASFRGEELGSFTGDGVIIATPTGSTAYSLAAQGPVIHPDVEAFVLTPICAHSFRQRPVVFPAQQTLELCLADQRKGNKVQLCLDGQRLFPLRHGDVVRVRKASYKLKLLQNPKVSYFEVLREKLSWGGR